MFKLNTCELLKKEFNVENTIFLTTEQIKKYQRHMTKMMEELIDLFNKNSIRYMLCGGCALGSIRHKGFIPWDDDLDIFIPREDYNKLRENFKHITNEYVLCDYTQDFDYTLPMPRIKDKKMIVRDIVDNGTKNCGAFCDVFILENTFDNKILRNIHGLCCMAVGLIASCRRMYKEKDIYMKYYSHSKNAIKSIKLKCAIGFIFSFLSLHTWLKIADKCYSLCKDNNSKYVVCPTGRKHFFGEMYLRQDVCDVRQGEFEGHLWNIPKNAEMYLTKLYGDYMKIPDKEHRETHAFLEFKMF